MDLCFISSKESVAKTGAQTCVFVCPDYSCREQLLAEGKEAVLYDEYLTADEGKKGDEFAFDLSVKWHYHNGEDFTKYKGASLGRAHEWTLWYQTLIPRMKYVIGIYGLLKREKADKVRFDRGLEAWKLAALRMVAAKACQKTKIEEFGERSEDAEDLFKNTPTMGYRHSRHATIKRAIGATIGRISSAINSAGGRRARILTSGYFAFQNLYLQWAKTRPFDLVFFAPSNVLKQKEIALAMPSLFVIRQAQQSAEARMQIERIIGQWEDISKEREYRLKFAFVGIDLYALFEREISQFFKDTLAKYAQEFDSYAHSLQMEKIGAVLLPFSVPPQSSLLLQAAKSQKIPVALLRHGITYLNDTNTRDDVDADYIFCWGQMQKEHYGAMQKKGGFELIETGNPKFDSIYGKAKKLTASHAGARPSILYLTTGKDNSVVAFREGSAERALLAFLDEMQGEKADITIKLHPAASKEYFQKLIEGRHAKMSIKIEKGDDPTPHIQSADVVVGTYSTTLLEAALSGKPTLFYNYNPLNEDKAYAKLDKYGLSEYTPETAKEMKKRILQILAQTGEGKPPAPFKAGGREYLCGPFDGKSSERVLQEIGKLAEK